jgi:hypothetical protein
MSDDELDDRYQSTTEALDEHAQKLDALQAECERVLSLTPEQRLAAGPAPPPETWIVHQLSAQTELLAGMYAELVAIRRKLPALGKPQSPTDDLGTDNST